MENTTSVLSLIIPLIITLLIGVIIRHRKIVSYQSINDIKTIIMNFLIPATVFNAFYKVDFTLDMLIICLTMSVISLLSFSIGNLLMRLFKSKSQILPYMCASIEGGTLGFTLFIMLFGAENLHYLAVMDLGIAFVFFGFLATKILFKNHDEINTKDVLKSFITPINIGILFGILISVSGISELIQNSSFGIVLDATLVHLSAPISALILIAVGYGIDFSKINVFETFKAVFSRMIVFGFFGFLMYHFVAMLVPDEPLYRYAVIVVFMLPPSYAYSVYIHEKNETSYLSSVLTVYTIFTLIAFSIFAWIVM